MAYNPTPFQNKRLWIAGGALTGVGIFLFFAGVAFSLLNTTLMVIGAVITALGHLIQVLAE